MLSTTLATTLVTVITAAYLCSLIHQPTPCTRPLRPDEHPTLNLETKLVGWLSLGLQAIATLLLLLRVIVSWFSTEINPTFNRLWGALVFVIYGPAKVFACTALLIYWLNVLSNQIPYLTENLVVSILLFALLIVDGISTSWIAYSSLFTTGSKENKGGKENKENKDGKEKCGYTLMVQDLVSEMVANK